MIIDPRHLEHIAAIVDFGTLQEAANHLGTSQPALSRTLRHLEDRIGVQLFERGSRPMVPTEMGRMLSDQGRAIKAARVRAAEVVALGVRGMRGDLKIGAPPFLCERLVGDAVADFFGVRPGIRIELVPDFFPMLERGVLLNQLDVVLCPIKLVVASKEDLRMEALFKDDHVIVARKAHPLAQQSQITTHQLEQATWIGHSVNSMLRMDMATALASIGLTNLNFAFTSESAGANFEMLRNTDFLTVLPRYALSQTQFKSGLIILPVELSGSNVTVGMLTRQGRQESPLLRAFKEHMRGYVARSSLTEA